MTQLPDHVNGPSASAARWWREWEFWILTALVGTIYFSRIADLPIRGEETRRAMVAWEMLETGDWIVPRQQGEPFLSRPPAGSWPIAVLAWLTGDLGLVVVRLPTVVATLLTTMLIYAYSRQFLSQVGALSSGLAFATFAQVLQLGRVAETEAAFTLLLGGALLLWHWGYSRQWPAVWTWSAAFLLVAAATLVKSLQAPVYFYGAVGGYLLWRRDWRFLMSPAHRVGLLLLLTVVAAWQLPFYSRLGWFAVKNVWASDVGLRLESLSPSIVIAHLFTYPLQVLGCLLPWSLLLPAFFWPQFRRTIGPAAPMVAFLTIAWLVALPTCWFVPNARPRYLMPLYPLAAPLVGLVVQRVYEAQAAAIVRRGWIWFIAAAKVCLIGAAVATTASWWIGASHPLFAQPWAFAACYLAATISGIALLVRNSPRWTARAATVTMLVLASFIGISYSGIAVNALVTIDPRADQQIAQLKHAVVRSGKLMSIGIVETMFTYHWRDTIEFGRLTENVDEVAVKADYFCFNWNTSKPPLQLPFPWRMEASINCDRTEEDKTGKVVIVGRRIDTVALAPEHHGAEVIVTQLADGNRDSADGPWMRRALVAWGALAAAMCIKVLVEGNRHSVYGPLVSGPRDWWAGAVMYDHRGYYYSPTFSVLFTPFALLPDVLGQMLWGLASVGLFVWSLRVFCRDVLPKHWPRNAEAAFLLLVLAGSLRGIWSMQSNALLMACILFGAAAVVRHRWWHAAWFLAGPVYIKVWPAVAAGLLSIHWPRKMIGRLTLCCIALGAIPFLTKAPTDVVDYYRQWIDCLANRQSTAERFTGYRDAWTIWEQIHSPVNKQAYFALQVGAGLAILGWCLWLKRRQRPAAAMVTYTLAAWACWQLLFGPGSERLTYLIAAPFAAWAVVTSYFERRSFPLAWAAFVTTFVLGAGFVERILIRQIPAAVVLQPIGVILLAAWLVRHAAVGESWTMRSTATTDSLPSSAHRVAA